MKKNLCFSSRLIIPAALTLVLAAPAVAQSETRLPSTVVRLSGHARGSTDGGKKWKTLKVGDLVASGSIVQTAQKSDLDIVLGEQVPTPTKDAFYNPDAHPGHLVSLSEDTALQLEKLEKKTAGDPTETGGEILLELRRGNITGNVKKLAADAKFEIRFNGGIVGTREAIYTLRASGELRVLKGRAFVAMTDGQAVREIVAGSEFDPGSKSTAPLPAPPTSEIPPAPVRAENPAASAAPAKGTLPPAQPVPLPRTGLRRTSP